MKKAPTKRMEPSKTKAAPEQKADKKGQKPAVAKGKAEKIQKARADSEVTNKQKQVEDEYEEVESPPEKAVACVFKKRKNALYEEESNEGIQIVNVHGEGQNIYFSKCFVTCFYVTYLFQCYIICYMLYNYSYAAWKQDDDDNYDVPESIDSLSGAASVDKKPSARDLSKSNMMRSETCLKSNMIRSWLL